MSQTQSCAISMDGRQLSGPVNTALIEFLAAHDIDLPHICYQSTVGFKPIFALSEMDEARRQAKLKKTKTVCTYCGVGGAFEQPAEKPAAKRHDGGERTL